MGGVVGWDCVGSVTYYVKRFTVPHFKPPVDRGSPPLSVHHLDRTLIPHPFLSVLIAAGHGYASHARPTTMPFNDRHNNCLLGFSVGASALWTRHPQLSIKKAQHSAKLPPPPHRLPNHEQWRAKWKLGWNMCLHISCLFFFCMFGIDLHAQSALWHQKYVLVWHQFGTSMHFGTKKK